MPQSTPHLLRRFDEFWMRSTIRVQNLGVVSVFWSLRENLLEWLRSMAPVTHQRWLGGSRTNRFHHFVTSQSSCVARTAATTTTTHPFSNATWIPQTHHEKQSHRNLSAASALSMQSHSNGRHKRNQRHFECYASLSSR